jgi:hypothetical protein
MYTGDRSFACAFVSPPRPDGETVVVAVRALARSMARGLVAVVWVRHKKRKTFLSRPQFLLVRSKESSDPPEQRQQRGCSGGINGSNAAA